MVGVVGGLAGHDGPVAVEHLDRGPTDGTDRTPNVSPVRRARHEPPCSSRTNPPQATRAAVAVTSTSCTYGSNSEVTEAEVRPPTAATTFA